MEETVKWEYTSQYLWKDVSDVDSRNNQILNKHGQEGWELISVDNNIAYFKRPIKQLKCNCKCSEPGTWHDQDCPMR